MITGLWLKVCGGFWNLNLSSSGSLRTAAHLLAAAEELQPDLIIADISMPLLNGIDAVRQIRRTNADVKVVFLTMHPDAIYAASAFEAGALGYVLKHSASSELITAIHSALRGKPYVTPLLAAELMQFEKDRTDQGSDGPSNLTPRQREVLQLFAEGHSAKETASILDISARTVEFHKYRMMDALGLKTVAELIRYAIKHGIVSR